MQIFINNFSTTLSAPASDTAMTLTVPIEEASLIPESLGDGRYLLMTLQSEADIEIVSVVGRSGATLNLGGRGLEGTSALSWEAGATVEGRLTAGTLDQAAEITVTVPFGDVDTYVGDASAPEVRLPWGFTITGMEVTTWFPQSTGAAPEFGLFVQGEDLLAEPLVLEKGHFTTLTSGKPDPEFTNPVVPVGASIVLTYNGPSGSSGAQGVNVNIIGHINPRAVAPFDDVEGLYADAYLAWEFEEPDGFTMTPDWSGNGHDGIVIWDYSTTSVYGEVAGPPSGGNAVLFEGAANVGCGNSRLALASGDGVGFTVEVLLTRGDSPPGDADFLYIDAGVAPPTEFEYVRAQMGTYVTVTSVSGANVVTFTSSVESVDTEWELYHIHVQRATVSPAADGALTLYRLGQQVGTGTLASGQQDPITFTRLIAGAGPIGGGPSDGNPPLAHVAVFDHLLTPTEMEDRVTAYGLTYLG